MWRSGRLRWRLLSTREATVEDLLQDLVREIEDRERMPASSLLRRLLKTLAAATRPSPPTPSPCRATAAFSSKEELNRRSEAHRHRRRLAPLQLVRDREIQRRPPLHLQHARPQLQLQKVIAKIRIRVD